MKEFLTMRNWLYGIVIIVWLVEWRVVRSENCSHLCGTCSQEGYTERVDCAGKNLTSLPTGIPLEATQL